MYPILSLLRRTCSRCVYVRQEHLERDAAQRLCVRIEGRPAAPLGASGWGAPGNLVPFLMLSASASTAEAVAQKLSAKENELADAIHALDTTFTLVFVEERAWESEGRHHREVRLAGVQGLYGATRGSLSPQRTETQKAIMFRGKDRGAMSL